MLKRVITRGSCLVISSKKINFAASITYICLMNNENTTNQGGLQQPRSFEISQIPANFGTGRLQDLLVTFDNLEREFPFTAHEPSFPVKSESFFTLTLLRGSMRMIVNLREVEIHEGQLLAMMPGCIFEGRWFSRDLRFCGMVVDKDYMETMRKNVGIRMDLTHRYYNYMIRDIAPAVIENHLQMYKMICRELTREDYTYKKEVIQRYCEIWVLKNISLNNYIDDKPELNKPLNRKEEIFHDFLSLLETYYTQERSISFYADRMCLTPKYLSTIIKEVSGKHGMQWIDEYVSLEAKALLRNSTLSVKQVSDQLNFPSQSMFGRFFKKMTGYSPKQYKLL